MLAVEFSLDVMQNVATRIEGKIDHVREIMNDGFQVCSFAM